MPAADGFEAFLETRNIFDPALAARLKDIYSSGDTRDPMELYVAFRGRAPRIYALLRQRGLKAADVEATLARWLEQQAGIQKAYTRTQLLRGLPADDAVGAAVWRSFHPDRAGDVAVVLKPYHLFSDTLGTGTTHGTPHAYDTHVPLLVYGPGVRAGVRTERVTPQACAATASPFAQWRSMRSASVLRPRSARKLSNGPATAPSASPT